MDSSVREDLASMLAENWFHSADEYHVTLRDMSDLSWKSYEIYLRDMIFQKSFTLIFGCRIIIRILLNL
jgi:hypothetical protein